MNDKHKQHKDIENQVTNTHLDEFCDDTPPIQVIPDSGYGGACWFRVSGEKAIGLGNFLGFIGSPDEIKAWVYNEFSLEAAQLKTKAIDLEIQPRINCLRKLKQNVTKQIALLSNSPIPFIKNTNERTNKINTRNKKSNKSKST